MNYEVDTDETITSANGMQTYQEDKAVVDIQIATAKRYPRDERRAIDKAIEIVTRDKATAETMTFSLRKGKTIIGPSVNLARVLAQRYGNMRAEQKIVGYTDTHVVASATCIDLETNYAIRTELRKSIIDKDGCKFSPDLITITGNAAAATAFRNAVFNVIPREVVDKVHNAVIKTIAGDLSDETKLTAKRIVVFDGFKKGYAHLNLTDDEICAAVGKQSINHITSDDIVALIGFENAIKNGDMEVLSIFRPDKASARTKIIPIDKSEDRILALIAQCKTRAELSKLKQNCTTPKALEEYDQAWAKLK